MYIWLGVNRYYISPPQNGVEEGLHELVKTYFSMYGRPLGKGCTRFTFDRGDGYVVKVPHNEGGVTANSNEANHHDPYIPLASCHLELAVGGRFYVLVMEKVSPCMVGFQSLPAWVMSVDCCQVGYNRQGELVAYDL